MGEFINFLGNNLADFWTYTGFANATVGHIVMILIGLFFIYLAVAKEFESDVAHSYRFRYLDR